MVLAPVSKRGKNACNLQFSTDLEMKLQLHDEHCKPQLPTLSFNDSLAAEIVQGVNKIRQCGFTWLMLQNMYVKPRCLNKNTIEIPIKFSLKAAFETQRDLIKDTYVSFVREDSVLSINNVDYAVSNCTEMCFPHKLPENRDDDDKIRLTVAVVLSCISVFMVVLLLVIIYMRRKRRGILHFRMTRLDEDDDELIGDMDDFVGSQGPTFRTYR
ncbi:uncharacterized protein LOC101861130 [Aplysia californica]|uniref:Uncharacterized protein LOC101861130 n=1 Tax=Aplysia californica TaxID=6500 RepID=A0ABM1A1W2_APLCA|nr:uncharacterized protein LOC101861130 [Aplysia californica]